MKIGTEKEAGNHPRERKFDLWKEKSEGSIKTVDKK